MPILFVPKIGTEGQTYLALLAENLKLFQNRLVMHGGVMKDKGCLLVLISTTLAAESLFSASPLFVFSEGRTSEYRDYGQTNLYRFVASNFTNELFDFEANLDANYCTPDWSSWKDTRLQLVELWKTALVPDGFIMCCCSKGSDENGANCMIYRVSTTSHRRIDVTRLDQFIDVSKFDTTTERAVRIIGMRGHSIDDSQIKGAFLILYANKRVACFFAKIGDGMRVISSRRIEGYSLRGPEDVVMTNRNAVTLERQTPVNMSQ